MDKHLYDKLFQEYVDYVVDIIRKKGIKTAKGLKDTVRRNINRVDLRLCRVVMANNARFGAFLDDTYESVGLATDIVIDD
ncbi:MAG: hypothetical protein IJ887_06070 [Prevotella sp.]|nr:hypothetical protein [Prevotella sp.]